MLERLSRSVFSCFQRFERAVTRFTDRVGPACVFFCTVLLLLGTITFFDVFYSAIFLHPEGSWLTAILGTSWTVYLLANIAFHYYSAVTVLPGSPADPPGTLRTRPFLSWSNHRARAKPSRLDEDQRKRQRRLRVLEQQNDDSHVEPSTTTRTCKRCPLMEDHKNVGQYTQPPKPERSHHCSICALCWLAFDHHCPCKHFIKSTCTLYQHPEAASPCAYPAGINGCVGLYNARYFLLFMVHMSLACCSVAVLGLPVMLSTFDFRDSWPHLTPRPFTLILWILCVAMGFALSIMSMWQIWLVSQNETSVEANDNSYYKKIAKRRKKTFLPAYDLGWRENIRDFFNVGTDRYPYWTILLPMRIEPVSDGWHWRKRKDWHLARVEDGDLLTDEEDG